MCDAPGPSAIASLRYQLDRKRQKSISLIWREARSHETWAGRLIGRRDSHRRSGFEVGLVHVTNRIGIIAKKPGRPQ
jgi:hypothetical protein